MGTKAWAVVLVAGLAAALGAPAVQGQAGGDGVGGADAVVTYSGWSFVRVVFSDLDELTRVLSTDDVRMMSEDPSLTGPTDLVMPARVAERFVLEGVDLSIVDDDIGPEMALMRDARAARGFGRDVDPNDPQWFDDYRSGEDIIEFWDDFAVRFPGFVTKTQIGTSVLGEPIWGYVVSAPGAPAGDKPGVCFLGMQHSREWISPATVTYVMDKMFEGYGSDPDATAALDELSWYVIPLVNPDGYEYSRSTARLWRKNRRDNGNGTFGVDLNRNWDANFSGPGSSSNTNSDIYHGPSAFSEPETAAVRDFILANPNIVAHIDWHSYSQLILWPIGYSDSIQAPLEDRLVFESVGVAMSDSILAQSGEFYVPQKSSDLYVASGVASDWAYEGAGLISWTFELRPDSGSPQIGFELPPSEIVPTGEENYEAVKALVDAVRNPLRLDVVTPADAVVGPGETNPTLIRAIASFGAELDESSVVLKWSTDGVSYADVPAFSFGGPVSYRADIPGQPCGAVVSYYYEASTVAGLTVTSPAGAPSAVYVSEVLAVDVVAEDAFESGGAGWQAGVAGDTATTGVWELADPEPTGAQPGDDFSDPGSFAFVTDGAGGSIGGADVDGGFTTLLSPVFDLSGADSATVSYARWYSNSEGNAPGADVFVVEVSSDGGATWSSLETVGPDGPGTTGGWVEVSYAVESVTALTDAVRFRFIAEDAGAGSIVEAAVDEFRLITTGTCCSGDVTGDAVVDLGDLLQVLSDFGTASAGSDATGDGVVDLADLLLVLSEFGTGC